MGTTHLHTNALIQLTDYISLISLNVWMYSHHSTHFRMSYVPALDSSLQQKGEDAALSEDFLATLLFGDEIPSFTQSFQTPIPNNNTYNNTEQQVILTSTITCPNFLPVFPLFSSAPVSAPSFPSSSPPGPMLAIPLPDNQMHSSPDMYTTYSNAYIPQPEQLSTNFPNTSCYQFPNTSFYQSPISSPLITPESDANFPTAYCTFTMDTTIATLPYSLPQMYGQTTNLPSNCNVNPEPIAPSQCSFSYHPYSPQVRRYSLSPPPSKKLKTSISLSRSSPSIPAPRQISPRRKNDHCGEFRRVFNRILDSDDDAMKEWAKFLRAHKCPKSRACIRTYLAFCDLRAQERGAEDSFVQLRSNPQWRRLGSRTDCHCTSFSPFFVAQS